MNLPIHATVGGEPNPIAAAKRIREAALSLGRTVTLAQAAALVDMIERRGIVFVGQATDSEQAARTVNILNKGGALKGHCGMSPEEAIAAAAEEPQRPQPPKPVEAKPEVPRTPTTPGYDTALAILAHADGNPVKAASWAWTYSRTSDEPLFFAQVQDALIRVFPWVADQLEAAEQRLKP